jgi:hypothetical protein
LTNLGEKMSEEEVEELFKSTIDSGNNEIDYRGTFVLGEMLQGEMRAFAAPKRSRPISSIRANTCAEFVKTIAEN